MICSTLQRNKSRAFRSIRFVHCDPRSFTLVPEAFFYSLLANFATRSAESREKKAFFFSRLGTSISASRRKFPNEKKIILKESLWDQGSVLCPSHANVKYRWLRQGEGGNKSSLAVSWFHLSFDGTFVDRRKINEKISTNVFAVKPHFER